MFILAKTRFDPRLHLDCLCTLAVKEVLELRRFGSQEVLEENSTHPLVR